MHFTLEALIQRFWLDYERAETTNDYIRLLDRSETMVVELMASLEGEEFISLYDNSPLMAMVSEVLFVCPEAVNMLMLMEENLIIGTAVELLNGYSDDERKLMRNIFIPRETTNVIPFEK